LVPIRDCPYWNTGPWTDTGQETQGYWNFLKAHLSAAPGTDPKLAFASSVIYGPDSKELTRALVDEAMERGLATWDCLYEMGREGALDRLRARLAANEAAQKDLNSGAAGRGAAVSGLT